MSKRRHLWSNKKLVLGVLVLSLITFLVCAAPLLTPVSPTRTDLRNSLLAPQWTGGSFEQALGTDALGRSVLVRMLYGGRVDLLVGASTVLLSAVIGIPLGMVCGFLGGKVDTIVMRLADIQLSIPPLLIAIVLISILGPGLANMIIAVGLTGWVTHARTVRSRVLTVREMDYVTAARALGCGSGRVLRRHVLPQVLNTAITVGTQQVGVFILFSASLSFLGLGIQPPDPSWGIMVGEGRDYLRMAWWISTFPGMALTILVLASFLMGEGVREVLDPSLQSC